MPSPTHAPSPPPSGDGYRPENEALLKPSAGKKFTFYMYRVQSDQDYPPENQNTANLAGALWYLHNEIVNNRGERRYGKTRIQRFKVSTRAPQPLLDVGLNFGARYAFDFGQCTGPFDCLAQFQRYGYFVGCNYVNQWPTQQWASEDAYANAMWYSLPGQCSSRMYNNHTAKCDMEEPGGACLDPTGQGNCTYSYASAGEISIDELEGIDSFEAFAMRGGWEYDNRTDRGIHMSFWNDKFNATACAQRVKVAKDLFSARYPNDPSDDAMPAPPCDFDYGAFYAWHMPPP